MLSFLVVLGIVILIVVRLLIVRSKVLTMRRRMGPKYVRRDSYLIEMKNTNQARILCIQLNGLIWCILDWITQFRIVSKDSDSNGGGFTSVQKFQYAQPISGDWTKSFR